MKHLNTQSCSDFLKLKAGEVFSLSGTVYTARDRALKKMLEENIFPDFLKDSLIFHAGPTNRNEMGFFSCGPTTSKRMDIYLPFLFEHGLFATIGKGERDIAIHKNFSKIYLLAFGGLGSLYGSKIEFMKPVLFKEFESEAVFKCDIKEFPLIAGIDIKGKSIFK